MALFHLSAYSKGIFSKLDFSIHKASGKNITYLNEPSGSYQANGKNSLTDGVRGIFNVSKYWHGFLGKDLVATIDLGTETFIGKISLVFNLEKIIFQKA